MKPIDSRRRPIGSRSPPNTVIMAKPASDAARVLKKNRKILDDVILTEPLKSTLIEKGVFQTKTIEEMFMVSTRFVYNSRSSGVTLITKSVSIGPNRRYVLSKSGPFYNVRVSER